MSSDARHLFSGFRRLPAPFWVLAGGTFVNRFATFMVPFLTLFMTRHGFEPWQAGAAVFAHAAGGLMCSFIAGPVADRYGRNRVMGVSLFLEACCVFGMGFAVTFPQIVTCAMLAGFMGQAAHPATMALIADIVPPEDRMAAQLAIRIAINGGWAFGPAVAGFVAQSGHYQWLFTADAATAAAFALLAWRFLPRGLAQSREDSRWRPALRALRACPPMISIMLASLCASFIFRQLSTTLSLQIIDHGGTARDYGLIQASNGVIIILLEVPLTALTVWLSYRRGVALGYLLLGLSLMLNALHHSVWMVGVSMIVFTFGEMICLTRRTPWIQLLAPPDMRGRFNALDGFSWIGGNLLGSWLGLVLYDRNPDALWWVCGALGVVSAALLMLVAEQVKSSPRVIHPESEAIRLKGVEPESGSRTTHEHA